EWTSLIESNKLERPHWLEAGEASLDGPITVIQLDGTAANLPPGTELMAISMPLLLICSTALGAYKTCSKPIWPYRRSATTTPGLPRGHAGNLFFLSIQRSAQSSSDSKTVTTGSPSSPGPQITLGRTSGWVHSRLSLRTWEPKRTSVPPARLASRSS